VYDDAPWIRTLGGFVRKLDTTRTPLVGICFGHQLIAHALDGETAPAEVGWAVGVHTSEVLAQHAWMTPCQTSFRLISSHKDQVQTLPGRATLFAASETCPIGGYTIDGHILTFQGHPEFEPEFAARLMTGRRELLGEQRFAAGMASLAQRIDSVLVARWIVNFIQTAKRAPADNV
jgi:GMP synthase-like glutamine amidotransferase